MGLDSLTKFDAYFPYAARCKLPWNYQVPFT